MSNCNAGKGALFKNDKKGVEIRPDYTGTAKIWDKDFYLSAWLKTSLWFLMLKNLAIKVLYSFQER